MRLTLAALLSLAAAGQAPQPQAPTTFRATVDVVAVDVSVIDPQGRPYTDLTVDDFSLKVDGRARRIRSAEFVSLRRLDDDRDEPATYSSNAGRTPGRLIMLVIDQANIRKGTGKEAFRAAGKFIDSLNRSDRVALQIIPGTGPMAEFTANHALVKAMLDRVVGQAVEADHGGRVGISESIAVAERNDEYVWQGILERECMGFHDTASLQDCRNKVGVEVREVYARSFAASRMSLMSLRGVIDRLALTPEPKTLVLISEGLVVDQEANDLTWVGPRTSAARVSLYGIRLSSPGYNATMARTSPTRERDQSLLAQGMDLLVGLGRGAVFPAAVTADASFSRLGIELSGYYLLTFEPEPVDRDGKNHAIAVSVGRKGAVVRARPQFSAEPVGSVKASDDLLTETMRSSLVASDFNLKVTTLSYRGETDERIKVILSAEIDRAFNPSGPLSLAYTIVRSGGGLAWADVEKTIVPAAGQEGRPQHYLSAVVLDPGAYVIKIAVVDESGRRASVERAFDAKLTAVGQIRLGDLMLARSGAGAGAARLRPVVDGRVETDSLIAYMEIYSEAEPQLETATLRVEIARDEDGRAVEAAAMVFAASTKGKRAAQASVPMALLRDGEYVARVILMAGGRPIGRVTRPFTVARTGAAAAGASTPGPAPAAPAALVPFTSSVDAFDRTAVLTRPVVGFFIDRLNVKGVPPVPAWLLPAIGYARMGRFAEAAGIVGASGSTHVAGRFITGLTDLAAGRLDDAARQFAAAVGESPEFFPAVFYLGACYASAGQDREAVIAWRSALVTDPAAPWVHTLLADALLRSGEAPQAVDLLRDAARLWPENDDVLMRWGTALSRAGQGDLALRVLDPYLSRHMDDGDRLLLGMRLIYEARTAGRAIESTGVDRARFMKYFDAYVAIKGADLARAREWRKFVDR